MEENRMPHIQLPEKLGIPNVILPGDPGRVPAVGAMLENARELACNREFRSIAGEYKGRQVLVTSTGIGAPSTAIAMEELIRCGGRNFIRIGSGGALRSELNIGDLVLASGAVRDDGTTEQLVEAAFPAIADHVLLNACQAAAERLRAVYCIGIIRSHSTLYNDRNEDIYRYWRSRNVTASDMETSAVFVEAALHGVRAASIINIVTAFHETIGESVSRYVNGDALMKKGEELEIRTALEAFATISGS